MTKESPQNKLSERYLEALRCHFDQGSKAGLQTARELGTAAVSIGLEILDLARIHDHAMDILNRPGRSSAAREDFTGLAASFFTEAITPIEETHNAALEANAGLTQLHAKLDERTLDLADSNRKLQQQITGRTRAQAALRDSVLMSKQLLRDSQDLDKNLQTMARGILAATEQERKTMSHQLNDEIAQTLLGINIRLLALKQVVSTNHSKLIQEIAITQRLVEESVNLINRLAHEFSSQDQRPAD